MLRPASKVTRREFIGGGTVLGLALGVSVLAACSGDDHGGTPTPSTRPRPRIDPRDHGAAADGTTDDTRALQRAIDAAADRAEVVLAGGRYLSGTLHLRSGTTLTIAKDAVLVGHVDDGRYDPVERLPYETFSDDETSDFRHALLAGEKLDGVTIRGAGTIDANRIQRGGPKPIALRRCNRVSVTGIHIENSPNYAISLGGCRDVEIAGVRIVNSHADGIDPDCCSNVTISDCEVDSLDDGICLKSSLILGRRVPTEHVRVRNCRVASSSNALKVGSETSGDVRDVVFEDCVLDSRIVPGVPVAIAEGGGIAIESMDGAVVEDVVARRIRINGVPAPLFVRLGRRGRGQEEPAAGRVRRIRFDHVTATGATFTSSITGIPGDPVRDVTLRRVVIGLARPDATDAAARIAENEAAYPTPQMFGVLPASGMYCRHVDGLTATSFRIRRERGRDPRPPLVFDDVAGDDFTDSTRPTRV
jgi:polygalacturonase